MATTTFLDIVASFSSSPPLRRLRFNNENRNALRRANNDEEGEEEEEIMIAVDCCLILFSIGDANIQRLQPRLGLLVDDDGKEVTTTMGGKIVDSATRQKSKNIDTADALFVIVCGCAFSKTFFIIRRRRFLRLEEEEEIKVENDIDAVRRPNPTIVSFVVSIISLSCSERHAELTVQLPRTNRRIMDGVCFGDLQYVRYGIHT